MRFLILFLILAAQGLGATQTVHIKGTGSDETNVIVKLNLHHGYQRGDVAVNDIFLNKTALSDFSNISFHGAADATLSHYLHSHGNYEVIRDNNRQGRRSWILGNGSIVTSMLLGEQGTFISSDNGVTYTKVHIGDDRVAFADSLDNIFVGEQKTFKLYKSSDYGANWTEVLDMTASRGQAGIGSICEDSDGNLYFGRYQAANAVAIYKSVDHGDTWSDVTPAGYGDYQHVHGMMVDLLQIPNAIYAGLDGAPARAIIRSTDGGATWVNIGAPEPANPTGMVYGVGWRAFGGEASINGGCSIYRTTDDSAFTCVVPTGQYTSMFRNIGDGYYAGGSANGVNPYSQIYRSEDGISWNTIYILDYMTNATVAAGPVLFSNAGYPAGDATAQALAGSPIAEASHVRIFDGGDHYSALAYIEIPVLPAAGMDIVIKTGPEAATSPSDKTIFAPAEVPGVIAHWKFNEGSGTAISDSSGNSKTAVLTPGAGSWVGEGRRAGAAFPGIQQTGSSVRFAGDGKIEVTDSATDPDFAFVKNFTYVVWVRFTEASNTLRNLIGRGRHSGYPLAMQIRTDSGSLQLRYHNGTAATQSTDGFGQMIDRGWHMIAVTLDDATPPNIMWTTDGRSTNPRPLGATPSVATQEEFTIGNAPNNGMPFIGDIDDAMVVSPALTATQLRAIYESRKIPTAEPSIDKFYYGLNPYEDAYVDTAVELNNFTLKGNINVKADATINNTIAAGIDIAEGKTASGTYNLFTAAAKTGDGTYSDATHTLWSTDPLFASATSFRIKPASPAINAGVDVGLTTDIEGKAIRGLPDIGAYEFAPAATNTILNRILFKRPIR